MLEFTLETLLTVAGICCLLVAGYQFYSGGSDQDLLDAMEETPTSPVAEVEANGYFEVKGTACCESPVHHSRVPEDLVFYRYQKIEEYDWTDREGHVERCRDVLMDESEAAAFLIEDASGQIQVNPRGARLEGKLLTRHVDEELSGASAFHVPSPMAPRGGQFLPRRRQGKSNVKFVHEITGAPVGAELYVLGSTVPGASRPAMFQKRKQEERPFVVSARSEEELGQRVGEGASVRFLLAVTFGLAAMTCLVLIVFLPDEYLTFLIDLTVLL